LKFLRVYPIRFAKALVSVLVTSGRHISLREIREHQRVVPLPLRRALEELDRFVENSELK